MFDRTYLAKCAFDRCISPVLDPTTPHSFFFSFMFILHICENSFSPLSFLCLPLTSFIVILPLLGFHLPSLSGPRGAASSLRSMLAYAQRPFELPSQLRPFVPLLCVPAQRLLGCWHRSTDLPPLARTLSKELPFWLGYHLFGTHLAMLTSWPSLKCLVQRQNKWTVSKTCQPWCFFHEGWEQVTEQ